MKRIAIFPAFALALVLSQATGARPAFAQPRDMGPSCVEQDRELAQTRRELKNTNEKLNRVDAERSNLKEELASKSARLGECQSDTQACVTAKNNLCAATGELVDDVLRGEAVDAAVGACVSAPKQGALESLLRGWRATTASLAAMASFASGESDLPMRQLAPPGSALPAERLAQRIYAPLRGAPPLFYRRLLIDAARAVAPRAWRRLQLGGSAGLDAWFSSAAPLDRSFLDEAQSRLRASGQGDDASALAQALDLVHAYQELVGCDSRPSALRGCARAESLQQLLETSGPLLVRRRLQSVWATECSSIDPGAVTHWLVEFPAAAAAQKSEWHDVYEAVVGKLYTCYLAEDEAPPTYGAWFDKRLPLVDQLSEATAKRVDAIRQLQATLGPSYNRCATAARALRNLRAPSSCRLPPEALQPLASWTNDPQFSRTAESPIALRACVDQVHLLWEGKVASTPTAFAHPPSPSQLVAVRFSGPESPVARLRSRCDARTFEAATMSSDTESLGKLAASFGERSSDAPWQLDENSNPIELGHYRGGQDWRTWGLHVAGRTTACGVLQLEDERCKACSKLTGQALDCSLVARLQTDWQSRDRRLIAALAIVAAFFFLLLWARRLRFALRRWRGWSERLSGQLAALAMDVRRRRWARLVPSAWRQLHVDLPHTPAWERWGRRAVVFGASSSADGEVDRKEREQVSERDVHQAALAAQAIGAEIALLIHAEGSTPTLAAVRALLDWAARPGKRGVHVLCVSLDRLKWARTSDDLLELVEDSSLRGNPFEVRGRLTSSGQFWNRERLVSGLLASAEAGRWVVVTGLRRMGKSSLALEVARRLPGPSAYVDLAGFHYEMARALDAAGAADAILRYVCLQLHSGARQRFGDRVTLPEPPPANTPLDAATLGQWLVQFSAVAAEQRSGAILIILDELEQALGVGPDQLPHSLLTLSTVVGRLRNALVTPLMSGRGPRIGLFVCSALHPILWAPLATLGHQSLMGAFESVCVPRLPVEAAQAMMRSLGMRQGIRFTDEALQLLVGEAQGIALLVRRLGSSVLELYDAERARQGQLGSVEIGIEGARAAVRREQDEGAPLRVWIESEIADASPAGQLLRRLANAKDARLPTAELRRLAQESILAQFAVTGLDQELTEEENQRRAAEAAGVLVRMLGESGLVELEGAEIDPDAYRLPNGLVRQILATNRLAKTA